VTRRGVDTIIGRRVLLALGTRETPRSRGSCRDTPLGRVHHRRLAAARVPRPNDAVHGARSYVRHGAGAFSNLLTMRHAGIKPVAMIEESDRIIAPRPGGWIARMAFGARVLEANPGRGRSRHRQGVGSRSGAKMVSARSSRATAWCSAAGSFPKPPSSGQPSRDGSRHRWAGHRPVRALFPIATYFAAGNLLRPVEASWTAWGEGRAVAARHRASLHGALPDAASRIALEAEAPVRYICPQRIAFPAPSAGCATFNVRIARAARGRLRVRAGKRELWGAGSAACCPSVAS